MDKEQWNFLEKRLNLFFYIGVILMVAPFVGGVFLGFPDFLIVVPLIGTFLYGLGVGGLASRKYIMKNL